MDDKKSGRINVYIDGELVKAAKIQAIKDGVSFSRLLAAALAEFLRKK